MIPQIKEINFGPGTDKAYATLHQATVTLAEMGERTISTQVRIDGDVVPDFTGWELEFRGERFVLPVREPQAMKDNSTLNSLVDLTFVSWPVQELKRYFFFDTPSTAAGTAVADQYVTPLRVNIYTFVQIFNKVLDYYFNGRIVMDLYGADQSIYSTDRADIAIDYTYIWDLLTKIYEIFEVRWTIEYNSVNNRYTIKVGYDAEYIDDHDFEYGYKGGLLKFERQVPESDITNILLGRGGEKNLPYRYFKRIDQQNPGWTADPDAIPELANIYFDRLHDVVYRWYIRGWMQNPNCDQSFAPYPVYSESDIPAYPDVSTELHDSCVYAFNRGLNDERFRPVEYVKDDASILKYGEHWGALDSNDDIYPTIQGRSRNPIGRVDETVDVSEIITDDIDAMAAASSVESNIEGTKFVTKEIAAYGVGSETFIGESFNIPVGKTANLSLTGGDAPYFAFISNGSNAQNALVSVDSSSAVIHLVNESSGTEIPFGSGIPAGNYHYKITLFANNRNASAAQVTFGFNGVKMVITDIDENAWKPTFDIWVKDIWNTRGTQGSETDSEYALRVWRPILGDRLGNEAKVAFSDGFMSISEDYDFVIASYPVVDRTKLTLDNVQSEWKITLYKSSAEYDATGLYIPNATASGKPVRGDHFYFLGIDMPFDYVLWGEEDVCQWKLNNLPSLSEVYPTWVINLDKVRVNTLEDGEYGLTLAERLATGAKIKTKDRRFTNGNVLTLYVQSISYKWNEPTKENPYIVPDIEVVLSDKVVAVSGPIEKLSNEVDIVKATYAKSSDIETVVRRVASPLFLKKTGEADTSSSPTKFSSKVSSTDFRQGDVGGAGWGAYQDGNGKSVYEVDKLVVRDEMRVNSLVANQISYVGGIRIESAANIECTQVIDTGSGYQCFFDQKRGSVANLFVVGDIAYLHDFNPQNVTLRYSKREVIAVDENSITLDKVDHPYVVVIDEETGETETRHTVDGSGIPQKGDEIVQYGHRFMDERQYVIISSVIGGGYQRMLSDLNHAAAYGKEYYFAGISGSHERFVRLLEQGYGELEDRYLALLGYSEHIPSARWFVGDADEEYAEWDNGILSIKGRLTVRKQDGSYVSMSNYIEETSYLTRALNQSTVIAGGLILTTMIQLGETIEPEPQSEDDVVEPIFRVWSGINGSLDTTMEYPERTIAAWYGGEMLEKDEWDHMTPEEQVAHRYAKTLFRHDGSGYLAGSNIYWDQNGYGGIPGITWDVDETTGNDIVTIGANVMLESLSGVDSSVTDLINLVRQINNMFEIVNLGTPENPANAVHVKNQLPLYSDNYISAGGLNPNGGGGGGGLEVKEVGEFANPNPFSEHSEIDTFNAYAIDSLYIRILALENAPAGGVTSVATLTGDITEADLAIQMGIGSIANGNAHLVTGGTVYSYINDTISSALKFRGITTSTLSDGSTTQTIVINGSSYTAASGDVVIDNRGFEFLWTGSKWQQLGDESSYVKKTQKINDKALSGDITITLDDIGDGVNRAWADYFLASSFTQANIKSTLGISDWALDSSLQFSSLPALYIGNASVQSSSQSAQDLGGIRAFTASGMATISGGITLDSTKRIWFGTEYIELDSNGYFHFSCGVWGESFGSFGGLNPNSGSGGSFDEAAMWEALGGSMLNKVIDSIHIPTLAFSDLTSHPTTISGYGITDAYINNGTITIGSNSITPLTSLPAATDSTYGGFMTGYSESGRYYAVGLSSGRAYVYVPWTDTVYTHPSYTATTINAGDGVVLSAITVDSLGHVSSVSSKNLVAADIPDISGTYVAITGAQTITGSKTFSAATAVTNTFSVGLYNSHKKTSLYGDLDVYGNTVHGGTISMPNNKAINWYTTPPNQALVKVLNFNASNQIELGAGLVMDTSGNITISGTTSISGATTITNTLTIGSASSYKKTTMYGALDVYGDLALGSSIILPNNKPIKWYNNNGASSVTVDIINYNASNQVVLGAGLTMDTSGNVTLSANNTFSGDTTIAHSKGIKFKNSGGTERNGISMVSNILVVGSSYQVTGISGQRIDLYYDGGIYGETLGMRIAQTTGRTTIYKGLSMNGTNADNTEAYIDFDTTNHAFHIHGSVYADGFISAGGLNPSGELDNYSGVLKIQTQVTDNTYDVQLAKVGPPSSANHVVVGIEPSATTRAYKVYIDAGGTSYNGLYVSGYAKGSSGWNASSDRRLKDNIELITKDEAIAKIMGLKPSTWNWKEDGRYGCGFVAQDVLEVIPSAVHGEDMLTLEHAQFHPWEVATLQSHEERIRVLEKENAELKRRLENGK